MKAVAVMVVIMLLGQTSYSSASKCYDTCVKKCDAHHPGFGIFWCLIKCTGAHCVGDKVSIAENNDTYCRMGCAYAKCANKQNLSQEEVKQCILNSCSNICAEKH
ncbi:hypothetical protein MKW98_011340 [Papaver atlanticum]|uniref:Thionin-like protein 2 n=1 Tax=Papaver atlanticum TaxID=357466 RepID=A0AAD4XJC7_9MAGN|nr:hypothetical protein MKW98_011340 [Papaver atlanticum]